MSGGTSATPSVAVVVVNYNSGPFIDAFCASLRAVSYDNWRLVVVDAHSNDDSLSRIEHAFPVATFLRCGDNVGFAMGANIGVREAASRGDDFILFLNPDTVVTPDFLATLVASANERMIVVPKILFASDTNLISTHAGGFDWRLGLFRDTFHGQADGPATNERRDNIETASFACALVPAIAFAENGPLDEQFFMYYEETDWLRRARDNGFRIRYEPSAVIQHRESGSSGGGWMTPFKMYYATRNRLFLVRKNTHSRFQYLYFTAYFWATRVATTGRLLRARRFRLAKAMWLGVRDYYRGRMGRTYQVEDL
jgi:GT2 family glycosyltransferase